MKPQTRHRRRPSKVSSEERAWKKWNQQEKLPQLTPEQILTWLDQTRELMFEVWRCNPALRLKFEKQRSL